MNTDDDNVVELWRLSKPSEYGLMLKLAREMESVRDSVVDESGCPDMWWYLQTRGFEAEFIERIAKVYWTRACSIVARIPYRYVVTRPGCESQRRLMAELLREVGGRMERSVLSL
jgi:hypothetical protein